MIPKGEEIFVNYGYPYSRGPKWYKELFRKFIYTNNISCNAKKEIAKYENFANESSNFKRRLTQYQHELKHKVFSMLNVQRLNDVSDETLDNILSTFRKLT